MSEQQLPPDLRDSLGTTFKRPILSLQVPSTGVAGEPRILIGPALPPPLDTYVFNAHGIGPTGFAAAIVWFGRDTIPPLDDLYEFIGIVDNAASVAAVLVYGMVQNGAVREYSAGRPAGLTTITQGAGVTTVLDALYDDITIANRAASTGGIGLNSANNMSLIAGNGISMTANVGNSVSINTDAIAGQHKYINEYGPNPNDTSTSGAFANMLNAAGGNASVSFNKRFDVTAIEVQMHCQFYSTVAEAGPEFGVRINGVDYAVCSAPVNNGSLGSRKQVSGVVRVAGGLANGAYTVQTRWRRINAAGTLNRSVDDLMTVAIREVDPN